MSENQISLQKTNPVSLLQTALEKGVDTDQLEKLMSLQERWEAKEAKKSFLAALSKFQSLVPSLKKGKTAKVQMKLGGYFSYSYADLGSITKQLKDALQECGLSYRWEFDESNGKMKVTCIVSHLDGHSETTSMEGGLDSSGAKNDIQQKGSTHTYLQRYTLIGALGLSTADEDKDGGGRQPEKETTEEEFLDQWKQVITQVSTRIELNQMYVKNRKVIDSSPKLKEWMKEKQDALKASETPSSNPANVMP